MILASKKSEVDRLLGKPVLTTNLLGLNHSGEKAFSYPLGAFDIIVGYINDIARYMALVRKRGPMVALTPSELSAAMALNAPAALWVLETAAVPAPKPATSKSKKTPAKIKTGDGPTTYLSYIERDPKIKDRVTKELFGWVPADAPYAFFFLPNIDGQLPLVPSEWAVDQKLG
ncbi:MAG: hypothetical protein WEB60_00310 [Terrimicrobiaceae bacterium]